MPYRMNLNLRFESSISQVSELLATHQYLHSDVINNVTDNILRASLTMLVSAIDTSVHELIISAVLFELKENKSIFNLDNIKVGLITSKELDVDARLRLIESDLRRQFSKESYQSSTNIENALAKIGIKKIWKKMSSTLNKSPEDIKIKLDLLVRRRNQIVHEGDLDHLHNIREIFREDLDDSFAFTKELVNGMISEYINLIEV